MAFIESPLNNISNEYPSWSSKDDKEILLYEQWRYPLPGAVVLRLEVAGEGLAEDRGVGRQVQRHTAQYATW